MKTTRVFSFSGKGGSGKTTTASLMLAALVRGRQYKDILVIDADPDANLSRTLNIPTDKTVGQVVDQRKNELQDASARGVKLRFSLWDSIRHDTAFDFLVMGYTTGAGCYCTVHSMLSDNLAETMAMYDLVLIDFDAGLEHFSRRTGSPTDTLLIHCDPSRLSFDTSKRIIDLVHNLSLPYEHIYLVGNRFLPGTEEIFYKMVEESGVETLGIIPYDPVVAARNLSGQDLLSIDSDNPAYMAAEGMLHKFLNTV